MPRSPRRGSAGSVGSPPRPSIRNATSTRPTPSSRSMATWWSNCLGDGELAHLNEFCDRTQQERPESWGLTDKRKPHHRNQGLIFSQPLLDYPELDPYTRPSRSFPVVARVLGGEEHVRFSEFNFRETPEGAGAGAMNFHHDAVREDRLTRTPYMPCDWLCAIHYLTDVAPGAPCFCVVPDSNRFETLQAAYEGLGPAYR